MKRINKSWKALLALLFITTLACEEIALEPQPEANNLAVFDEFWTIFNEKYAMFEAKGVDWQQIRTVAKPWVDNSISQDSLFSVLAAMTLSLRDAHTSIVDQQTGIGAGFDIEEGFPVDLDEDLIASQYLDGSQKELGGFVYTTLPGNVGYVIFRDFLVTITEEQVDQILTELANTKGLIIDVRGNGGGDPFGAGLLASHFTTTAVDAGFERFKTGPGPNDFADSPFQLQPTTGVAYTKPVAVLTDRLCYSATTTFLYLMDPLPNVTLIGGFTGGGSGSVADGELLNGWTYSLSISEYIDFRGRHLDDGVEPDILINLDHDAPNTDEIIERALLELN